MAQPPVATTMVAPSPASVPTQHVVPNSESKIRRPPEHRAIEFDKIEVHFLIPLVELIGCSFNQKSVAQDERSNEDKYGVADEVNLQKKDGGEVEPDEAEVMPDPMQVEGGEVTAPLAYAFERIT